MREFRCQERSLRLEVLLQGLHVLDTGVLKRRVFSDEFKVVDHVDDGVGDRDLVASGWCVGNLDPIEGDALDPVTFQLDLKTLRKVGPIARHQHVLPGGFGEPPDLRSVEIGGDDDVSEGIELQEIPQADVPFRKTCAHALPPREGDIRTGRQALGLGHQVPHGSFRFDDVGALPSEALGDRAHHPAELLTAFVEVRLKECFDRFVFFEAFHGNEPVVLHHRFTGGEIDVHPAHEVATLLGLDDEGVSDLHGLRNLGVRVTPNDDVDLRNPAGEGLVPRRIGPVGFVGEVPQVRETDDHVIFTLELFDELGGGVRGVLKRKSFGIGTRSDLRRIRCGVADDGDPLISHLLDDVRSEDGLSALVHDVRGQELKARNLLLLLEHGEGTIELVVPEGHGIVADAAHGLEVRPGLEEIRFRRARVNVTGRQQDHRGPRSFGLFPDLVDQCGLGRQTKVSLGRAHESSVVIIGVQKDDFLGVRQGRGEKNEEREKKNSHQLLFGESSSHSDSRTSDQLAPLLPES